MVGYDNEFFSFANSVNFEAHTIFHLYYNIFHIQFTQAVKVISRLFWLLDMLQDIVRAKPFSGFNSSSAKALCHRILSGHF